MSSPLLDWTVGMFLLSYMACIEYNDQIKHALGARGEPGRSSTGTRLIKYD